MLTHDRSAERIGPCVFVLFSIWWTWTWCLQTLQLLSHVLNTLTGNEPTFASINVPSSPISSHSQCNWTENCTLYPTHTMHQIDGNSDTPHLLSCNRCEKRKIQVSKNTILIEKTFFNLGCRIASSDCLTKLEAMVKVEIVHLAAYPEGKLEQHI